MGTVFCGGAETSRQFVYLCCSGRLSPGSLHFLHLLNAVMTAVESPMRPKGRGSVFRRWEQEIVSFFSKMHRKTGICMGSPRPRLRAYVVVIVRSLIVCLLESGES